MIESQKMMRREKSSDTVPRVTKSGHEKKTQEHKMRFNDYSSRTRPKSKTKPETNSETEKSVTNSSVTVENEKALTVSPAQNITLDEKGSPESTPTTPIVVTASKEIEVALKTENNTFNWFGGSLMHTPDVNRAVDELMEGEDSLNSFISNVVEHVKSPAFNPEASFLDLSINSALKQVHNYINKRRRSGLCELKEATNIKGNSIGETNSISVVSPFDADQFINIKELDDNTETRKVGDSEHHAQQQQLQPISVCSILEENFSREDNDIENSGKLGNLKEERRVAEESNPGDDEEVEEYDSNDTYLPMDESQMLENVYVSDTDLLRVFKSKKLHPYLKPTVHLLLSKNNSLKVINPSSPIMRQLDSTGKLFLENYVTNLAMTHLNIGNDQFFLDCAISQASTDPAILYCLVAWGGMFLVGRDNEIASMYFDKSLKCIQERKEQMKLAKFDNEKYLQLMLFYVLLSCADISTGDVGRWYHMLLQCKDIINQYGGLKQFVNKNKDNKVAKWILSNIFYHDVLSTRTTDLGTVISMDEYKDVFKAQKFLQDGDYGLDPFYGLSQDLYLLLGEVANGKKALKSSKFPLSFIPANGPTTELSESYFRKMEESWFQIYDKTIQDCKPSVDMLATVIKNDPKGKLLEHHLTFFELTQTCLRIYIRITFKEIEFDNEKIQSLWKAGIRLFNILIGTKLQSLLGFSLLMLGVTSITEEQRELMKNSYDTFLRNYQILNVQVCWEIIRQVWKKYDDQVANKQKRFVDWSETVSLMGWNCCFS
ncbi:hypothetical protein PMKS-003908 [Pichia membranifaciens]|uniref:Uncharacterized protein n=1 Tax=Pichia membranifaciens TaxID=4926 RepID=A0A1Q2YLG3_9ASCO|nr:hypothetical protein PMKS-003908 [Pichia membranifaciens]